MKTVLRRDFLRAMSAATLTFCGAGSASRRAAAADGRAGVAAYDELMTDFVSKNNVPGAALAVTRNRRLMYAKGFGLASVERKERVTPTSLFRIASLSKPITSVAILQLAERGKLKLDDPVLKHIPLQPVLLPGAKLDPRLKGVTVRHCLQHTGGWDRGKSPDPMASGTAVDIAKALRINLPVRADQIIRYTLGKPLDFDPGSKFAYSNFGYCLLGRVIETVSGKSYGSYVSQEVLAPLGITRMRLGKSAQRDRAPGEVHYYDAKKRTGRSVSSTPLGVEGPFPYTVELLEPMDANGGWIASAVDLVRFASAFDNPDRCRLLKAETIRMMLAPPAGAPGHEGDGTPKARYYACGWDTRPVNTAAGKYTKWHLGLLTGTSSLMVCRADGIDWVALFNTDGQTDGKSCAEKIDAPLHGPADAIRNWPEGDLFAKYLAR
jgi:N-acyl-D-amino-acid deacylase